MTFATLSTPIQAFAHNAYFLGVTVDTGSNRYMGTVAYDDNSMLANNHKEAQIAGFYNSKILDDSFSLPTVDPNKMGDDAKDRYKTAGVEDGNGDKAMIYTFPAVHTRALVGGTETDASSKDMDRAYWVNETLIGSFNDALSFIMSNSGYSSSNSDNNTKKFMDLGVALANAGKAGGTVTFNSKTFTVTKGYDKPANGLKSDDYVQIKGENTQATPFIYKVPKGYFSGQPLSGNLPEKYAGDNLNGKDVDYLTWKHIVLQGNYNYEVSGTSYAKVTEILKPDKFSQAISDLLNFILGSLRSALGLYSFQELMLNDGVRSSSYYYGIMPNSWYISAQTLHFVSQVIAWALIIGALVKLLIQRNFASINTSMRVSLMEGIQNIVLTGFLLTLIIPLFQILASLNMKLVAVFAHASLYSSLFGTTSGTSSGLIGGIILNIMYFLIMCYFNFVYIIRGITVALLYGTAPLFVCSIAFGGKYKQLFGNFVKELVTNIYLQTFHAICLAFFASVSVGGSARGIESIVLIYAFIPLTQFFRTNLMGLSGDMGDKLAGNALSTGASMATGFFMGSSMGNKQGKASAGASSGAGSGAGAGGVRTQGANASGGGGIQTKSSDQLRNRAESNKSSATSGSTTASGGHATSVNGGANDEIPNAQLTKLGKAKEALGNFADSKTGKTLGATGKMAGNIGKMAFGAGMAIGGSAVGSRELTSMGTRSLSKGANGATSQVSSGYNAVKGKVGQAINDHSYVKQDEGFMYSQDLGNGTIDYKHGMAGLEADTGIAGMTDTGNGVQYELGGRYDKESNSFEYGSYNEEGKFEPNESLNGTQGHANLNEMLGAFASDDDEAKDFYKKQGIADVGYTKDGGNLMLTTSKGYGGVNRVSSSGSNYVINKGNTAPVSMKDVTNVPSYGDHSAKIEAQKEQAKEQARQQSQEQMKVDVDLREKARIEAKENNLPESLRVFEKEEMSKKEIRQKIKDTQF